MLESCEIISLVTTFVWCSSQTTKGFGKMGVSCVGHGTFKTLNLITGGARRATYIPCRGALAVFESKDPVVNIFFDMNNCAVVARFERVATM